MPNIISATFKTRSAVVTSTFKVGGVVSSTFKIGPSVTSVTFRTVVGTISSTFRVGSGVLSSTFHVTSQPINEGVTYTTSSDCSKLIVSLVTDLEEADIASVLLTQEGNPGEIPVTLNKVEGAMEFHASITLDGVFTLNVLDTEGNYLIRMPLLVTCRLNKCFNEQNEKELALINSPTSAVTSRYIKLDMFSTDWLKLYVLYRGVRSAFLTGDYETAVALLKESDKLCECNCGCATC